MPPAKRTVTVLPSLVLCLAAAAAPAAEAPVERKVITLCGERLELLTGPEVKALGFPWTDVPDDENAATDYTKGANALHALSDDLPDWHDQFAHATAHGWDDKLEALGKAIDMAKPALDHYRKGASKTLCQLHYHKTAMLAGMLLPGLGRARDACRLLAAEARRFEARGKFKEAVDNYLAVIRIGEHYGTARTLIDHLVGIACVSIGAQNAFKGVYRGNYPKKELARFLKTLGPLRERLPDFAHAMRGEKAFGLGTMDDTMRLGPGGFGAIGLIGGPVGGLKLSPLQVRLFRILFPDRTIKADMAAYYDRMIAGAKKPFHAGGRQDDDELMKRCKPWNLFAAMLLPALARARTEAERCRAMLEMLRLALALKMYQQDTGVYPDELKWLVGDKYLKGLPADPFSGKPFRYKAANGQFVLYSVGENLKDDGGALKQTVDFVAPDCGVTSKLPPAKPYKK